MTTQKWGESFLKSGLPLEHLALMSLKSIGWTCEPHWEYRRINREGVLSAFEIDLIAYSPGDGPELILLAECKYHDEARFWFFLPCETEDHLAQREALSAGPNLRADAELLHSAPYEMVADPGSEQLIGLAPLGVWGVTVSHDGSRQVNAIEEATKQLTFGYVPFCLDRLYGCHRPGAAVLPVIITSARLFRLRPTVMDLADVRRAADPHDIADEVPWLWLYHAPDGQLLDHNMDEIDRFKQRHRHARRKVIDDQLTALWSSPPWIAVTNVASLGTAVQSIHKQFRMIPKDLSGERLIASIQRSRRKERPQSKRQGA